MSGQGDEQGGRQRRSRGEIRVNKRGEEEKTEAGTGDVNGLCSGCRAQ